MTDRAFHDAVLEENAIPIDMIRASLTEPDSSRQTMRRTGSSIRRPSTGNERHGTSGGHRSMRAWAGRRS